MTILIVLASSVGKYLATDLQEAGERLRLAA